MQLSMNIDEILARHLAGESLSQPQQQALDDHIAANKGEYDRLVKMMHRLNNEERSLHVDAIAAWHKVEAQLREEPQRTRRLSLRPVWMVAATLLLLVGFGFYRYFTAVPTLQLANNTHETKTYRLPDGSTLKLYPNATVAYEASDSKAERKVTLQGKAFFDVNHNGQTFSVSAGQLKVDVLGTSFAIDATHEGHEQVSVSTGRVLVTADKEQAVLTRGQRITVLQGHMRKDSVPTDQRQGNFVFRDLPIRKAIAIVERSMDIRIELADGIDKGNRVTTNIAPSNPSEVVRELALLCNCRYDSISPIHYKLHP